MKRRSIKFEINFTNKWLYTFVFFGIILMISIGVFAYNSGKAPSVMGHTADEITGVCKTDGTGCPSSLTSSIDAEISCRVIERLGSARIGGEVEVCCGNGEFVAGSNVPEFEVRSQLLSNGCVKFTQVSNPSSKLQVNCCRILNN